MMLIVLVIVTGTVGFMFLEKYDFLDALYMTMITVSTIGYGEVHPLNDAGRVFNIFLIAGSLTTTAFALTMATRYVIDGEINLYFKNRRLMNAINKLGKSCDCLRLWPKWQASHRNFEATQNGVCGHRNG